MGIVASTGEIRDELYCRTGELLGYHEKPYMPKDSKPDCNVCERVHICPVCANSDYGRYARGKCPKVK
jgi:hypothetical protein